MYRYSIALTVWAANLYFRSVSLDLMGDAALADIGDLPPSVKLVFFVLKHGEPLTQQKLTEEALLPERTAREALTQLKQIDAVNEEIKIR